MELPTSRSRGQPLASRTGPARTIVDLAKTLDEDVVVALGSTGFSQGITTAAQIGQVLGSCRRHQQRRLTDLLGEVELGVPKAPSKSATRARSRGLTTCPRRSAKPLTATHLPHRRLDRDFHVFVELDGRVHQSRLGGEP